MILKLMRWFNLMGCVITLPVYLDVSLDSIIKIYDLNSINSSNFFTTYQSLNLKKVPLPDSIMLNYINFLLSKGFFNMESNEYGKYKIVSQLEALAPILPSIFYWKNKNGVYLGVSTFLLEAAGLNSSLDIIGKTDFDLWPQFAEELVKNDQEVMKTGKAMHKEEDIITVDGSIRHFAAVKVPLHDDNGNIVGIIGNSIEITDTKEKEKLQRQNQIFQAEKAEQEKFAKDVNQMVHDIQSPLSSLRMMIQIINDIPEKERITLRAAVMSITDITNHLLRNYNKVDLEEEKAEALLLSAALFEVLSEKRYQYKNLLVKFVTNFTQNSNFAFIKIIPSDFKRMLSNILNNSVDALEGIPNGTVTLKLDVNREWVIVTITDNAKEWQKSYLGKSEIMWW